MECRDEDKLTPRCRLSDPAHPHTLCRRDNPPPSDCFKCGPLQGNAFDDDDWHYYCDICELVFHENCHTNPQGVRHPYHLHHPIAFTVRYSETDIQSFNMSRTEIEPILLKKPVPDNYIFVSDKSCDWCENELGTLFFRCLLCNFSLDRNCFSQDPPFIIETPKSHRHTLTFFPRPLLIPCSACGLKGEKDPSYVCLPCNYFVHKKCIDLPRVIKLTRHPHRLSLTSCLPPSSKRSCGVCHRSIDVKNGLYSCNKGCSYAVHSRCATRDDVWDGIDLEGVPEEPIEDVSPFKEVGYNLINHFIHEHDLRFHEKGSDLDVNQQCTICSRPMDLHGFYKCTILECQFFLHDACANLPTKKEHPLHKHPLVLQPGEMTKCGACRRAFNGFRYACSIHTCDSVQYFEIDVGCASICEPFEHKIHPHPLSISPLQGVSTISDRSQSKHREKTLNVCGVCGKKCYHCVINCNENCDLVMCFKCATIPVVVHYKHDQHPLSLCCGENSSEVYWCEVCEKEIDPKKWFYTCNECCITAHVECIFGPFMHLRVGTCSITVNDAKYEFIITSNKGNTRPICEKCGFRCRFTGFFIKEGSGQIFCSNKCTDQVNYSDALSDDGEKDKPCKKLKSTSILFTLVDIMSYVVKAALVDHLTK